MFSGSDELELDPKNLTLAGTFRVNFGGGRVDNIWVVNDGSRDWALIGSKLPDKSFPIIRCSKDDSTVKSETGKDLPAYILITEPLWLFYGMQLVGSVLVLLLAGLVSGASALDLIKNYM